MHTFAATTLHIKSIHNRWSTNSLNLQYCTFCDVVISLTTQHTILRGKWSWWNIFASNNIWHSITIIFFWHFFAGFPQSWKSKENHGNKSVIEKHGKVIENYNLNKVMQNSGNSIPFSKKHWKIIEFHSWKYLKLHHRAHMIWQLFQGMGHTFWLQNKLLPNIILIIEKSCNLKIIFLWEPCLYIFLCSFKIVNVIDLSNFTKM